MGHRARGPVFGVRLEPEAMHLADSSPSQVRTQGLVSGVLLECDAILPANGVAERTLRGFSTGPYAMIGP